MTLQTKIARAQLRLLDEPTFDVVVEPLEENRLSVRGRMVEGRRRVAVTVEWINRSLTPNGEGGIDESIQRGVAGRRDNALP